MFEEVQGALQAPEVAQGFQRWVCPEIRSPYINWMLHDATVTIQAIRPYGLGMFSGDLLEGSNRGLCFSARNMLSSARNHHFRARYAVFKRGNP